MIRFITCLRRRPELSPAQFRAAWESRAFDDLIEKMAALTGATRTAKSVALAVEANLAVQLNRGTLEPYDGVLEYFLPSPSFLESLGASDAFWALQREMSLFQEGMADLGQSVAFFTTAE